MSACKKAENGDGVIVRLYNTDLNAHKASIIANEKFTEAYITNLDEKRISEISLNNGKAEIELGAKKIVTIELD